MEYLVIAIAVIAIVLFVFKSSKKTNKELVSAHVLKAEESTNELANVEEKIELVIQMEMLPVESIEDESKLVEITDSKILARVNNLIPGLAQAGNTLYNAVQAKEANGEILYRAIIPAGAKLANSKAMDGAVRGIYYGSNGIKGHANLIAVEAQKGSKVGVNVASAAMGVASMVFGQYYMTKIDAELRNISDGIYQIADFHNNEYRSRVFSLFTHIKQTAGFQSEIIENDELRLSKIHKLDNLEEECTQLLGQANLTLAGFAKKNDLDFEAYEKELGNAQKWFEYQKALLDVLYKISDLRYALHLGKVSRENCNSLLPIYIKQVNDTQVMLTKWHEGSIQRLKIDTDRARRREGFDKAIHAIPALFDDNHSFITINRKTAEMISVQATGHNDSPQMRGSELYDEDVQLISKNGKIYYLPDEKENAANKNPLTIRKRYR